MLGTRAAAGHSAALLLDGIRAERNEKKPGPREVGGKNKTAQESSQMWTFTPVILAA